MGICNLCQEEKKLIKKSHIISKLLFRDLLKFYPRKIIQFDVLNSNKTIKKHSDTLYDDELFCEKCDKEMGLLEDYFKKYITRPKFKVEKKKDIDWIIYTEYDFNKFFLFFNIQVYRASLSNRNEFKMVNLNENIIEKIRLNIINREELEKTNEIAIIKFSENSNFKNSIGSFIKIGDNYFIILRDFIVFYFFYKNDILFSKMKGHIIDKEKIIVPVIPKNYENEFIKKLIGI